MPENQSNSPVSVSVAVDRPTVRVGDLVRYTISVNAATNVNVILPEFGENLKGLANMLIHDWETKPQEKLPGGRTLFSQSYELETYLTGLYEIPPAVVRFSFGGATNVIQSSAVCVEIVSLTKEGEMEDIRDVKDPVEVALSKNDHTKILLALAALAAVGAVLLLGFRRKKEKSVPPPPPAHITALSEIERLRALGLLEQNLFEKYLGALSDILRRYIENRFQIKAPEQTTEEFLQVLRGDPAFSFTQREMLRGFLSECDLVKFANQKTSLEAAEDATSKVVSFIEETKEKPEEEKIEKEGGEK